MNDVPRQTLRRILAKHGKEIAGNAERCRGLLNDLCGAYRREINVLVTAIEERVPLDLLAAARSVPTELLLTRLEKRLADQTGLTPEAARWSVESWALALGAATEAEIAARNSKPSDLPTAKTDAARSAQDESKIARLDLPLTNASDDQQPPILQGNRPSTKTAPPVNRQPAKAPFPTSPPASLPVNNQPVTPPTVTNYPPTPNQLAVSKSRPWLFRGCLVFVFMLIVSFVVLLFGVPFALEKMRETQRERQNEPPRFPVR